MRRFILKLKDLQQNWKPLVGLFVIALSVSSALIFAPSPHPAQAFLGIEDLTITEIDLQNFAEDLLESFAETLTEGVIKTETNKAITGLINQYHVGSYLQYAANLKNQVFAAQAIANDGVAGQNQLNQYIVKSIITDIDTNPVAHVNIDPLYQKAALDAINIQSTTNVTVGAGAQNFMAKAGSFEANAGGQYLLYADLTQKINTKAAVAAAQDIATASGNKSTYNCSAAAFATGTALTANNGEDAGTAFNDGSDYGNTSQKGASSTTPQQTSNNSAQINCALQNPGNYVGSVLAGNVQGLFNRAIDPSNNHLSAIAGAIASAFAGIAQQALIGGSSGGTLISANIPSSSSGSKSGTTGSGSSSSGSGSSGSGSSSGSGALTGYGDGGACETNTCVYGASTSNYGTLYAIDASGNVIAGSGTSVSNEVTKKSAYTIEWNAGLITGASYVAFAPCSSNDCTSTKDRKELDGSMKETASGIVQTYTLQVWGMDQYGNMTILETDSIDIKVK
jgi:uncharacterized membrane protein YgcG